MRLTLTLGVLFLSAACGASRAENAADAAPDAPFALNDGGTGDESPLKAATWPTFVFVDGLVNGAATATNKNALTLDNVRVCLFDHASHNALTKFAIPDSTPMPLANYPGVKRGTGMDLGSYKISGVVDVAIFSAFDLRADSANSTSRAAYACATMTCDGTDPCQPHVLMSIPLIEDVNVVALVDVQGGGVSLQQSKFDDVPFSGAPNSLAASVVDFSGWHAGAQVAAFYGNYVDGSGAINVSFADPLTPNTATSPKTVDTNVTASTYDGLGIRFDQISGQQVADRFGQSLDSIAYLSNPALDPPTFYGLRENIVFALVGDPTDVTSVTSQGGRDWQFKGTGLHVTAVPYAPPVPQ